MRHLGDYPVSATIDFKWNTQGANGASITRGTNGSIRIYKNNSTTERTSSNGITDTEDFDSLTGVHHLRIDLSDNTDAGFYAAGNEYQVVLQGAGIDSQTVNAVIAEFSIERANGILALLKSATFGLSALKTLIDTVDDFVDTEVAAIKAKTDQLTFTTANQVDCQPISIANNAITAAAIAANAIGSSELAAGAITAATFAASAIDNTALANGAISAAKFAAGAIDAAAIAADAIGSSELATTAVNEIRDAILSDSTAFAGATIAAINSKTTNLPPDPADASDIAAAFAALNNISAAQVKAQVVAALATDTYAEPSGAPPATNTLEKKIAFVYEALRNKVTVTSATMTFYNDADVAQWSKALSDDGTTYTEAEGV